jgi:hypothetical protein
MAKVILKGEANRVDRVGRVEATLTVTVIGKEKDMPKLVAKIDAAVAEFKADIRPGETLVKIAGK